MVALLRGVNVNGITIRNADLAGVFDGLGLSNVRTVLASGNVVFESPEPPAILKPRIEAALSQRFAYDAWIVLVEQGRLALIVAGYPFERDDAACHPYIVFGSDDAILGELAAEAAQLRDSPDLVRKGDGVIYWRVPRGSTLDSPFARVLGRARYRPHITTRNLRTAARLLA